VTGYRRMELNRIDKKFNSLKAQGKKAFIAYICAGDPDLSTTGRLVLEFDKAGVDIVELGIPFSDPLADGPTIQNASQRAIKRGVNIPKIFEIVKHLRKKTDMPIVLMGYYNPIYSYGVLSFIRHAKIAGVDGIIVPDLIPEEADEFISESRKYDLSTIFLAAPTSSDKRLNTIVSKSTGFIYYVSLAGVTGARKSLAKGIREHVQNIKQKSKKPVCIGFGVSTPMQARKLSQYSDGVIVGSAIIKFLEKNLGNNAMAVKDAVSFVKKIKKGLN
jgi:tryptophan synthase alpha chain